MLATGDFTLDISLDETSFKSEDKKKLRDGERSSSDGGDETVLSDSNLKLSGTIVRRLVRRKGWRYLNYSG